MATDAGNALIEARTLLRASEKSGEPLEAVVRFIELSVREQSALHRAAKPNERLALESSIQFRKRVGFEFRKLLLRRQNTHARRGKDGAQARRQPCGQKSTRGSVRIDRSARRDCRGPDAALQRTRT